MIKKIKKVLKPLKYLFLVVFSLAVFLDIFIFKIPLGFLILFIFSLWILSVWLFNYKAKISFYLALSFLALLFFLMILKLAIISDKVAVWLYLFFFWAVCQQLKELLEDSSK